MKWDTKATSTSLFEIFGIPTRLLWAERINEESNVPALAYRGGKEFGETLLCGVPLI